MNFFFGPRYNLVDVAVLCATAVLVAQGKIIVGIIIAVLGILISTAIQVLVEYLHKDRPWQQLVKQGRIIEAIRVHGQIHGSTLSRAVDEVVAYRNQQR